MDWDQMPDQPTTEETVAGLKDRNFNPLIVNDSKEALEKLKQIIPAGADVMTGASTTLEEIGFIDYLKNNQHPWQNWKDRIFAEKDSEKQRDSRRMSTTAGFFLGSVQAITRDGRVLGCDATGSRQGGYVFGAKNVIWVTGINKLVSDLDMAFRRLREHCLPLEDAHIKKQGGTGSFIGKMVIYEREVQPHRITTILIRERLGF